jgi:hypothetical protein
MMANATIKNNVSALKSPSRGASKHMTIKVDQLKKSFFVRQKLDQDRVLFLGELMEAGETIDPILVSDDDYEIVDGRHRYEAALLIGWQEIDCVVRHYTDQSAKVAAAVTANYGGAAQMTTGDLRQAVTMMVEQGCGIKRLREILPIPPSIVKKLHQDAWSYIRKRKLTQALHSITDGNLTLQQAAEKFGIELNDLKIAISTRKKKEKTNSIGNIKMKISTGTRSTSQQYRHMLSKAFDLYEDGNVGDEYVEDIINSMMMGCKRIEHYVLDAHRRFQELQKRQGITVDATDEGDDE